MSKIDRFFETLFGVFGAVVFGLCLSLILIGAVTVFHGVVLWIWLSLPVFIVLIIPFGFVYRLYFMRYAAPVFNFFTDSMDAEGLSPKVILLSLVLIVSILLLLLYALLPMTPWIWTAGVLLFLLYAIKSKEMSGI